MSEIVRTPLGAREPERCDECGKHWTWVVRVGEGLENDKTALRGAAMAYLCERCLNAAVAKARDQRDVPVELGT